MSRGRRTLYPALRLTRAFDLAALVGLRYARVMDHEGSTRLVLRRASGAPAREAVRGGSAVSRTPGIRRRIIARALMACAGFAMLAACSEGEGNILTRPVSDNANIPAEFDPALNDDGTQRETIWDLFVNTDDPNITLEVNRFLWNASLDVLSFLPIETVDPFSGVIVMGYGTPPGGGRAYRATIQIRDPALDARSLRVAMATRSGPVDADTKRAVEDAILTRARQLRIADGNL